RLGAPGADRENPWYPLGSTSGHDYRGSTTGRHLAGVLTPARITKGSEPMMTTDEIKSILSRVEIWPQERQQQFIEFAREIESEFTSVAYHASADERDAIDAGLTGEAASDQEVSAAFEGFRGADRRPE